MALNRKRTTLGMVALAFSAAACSSSDLRMGVDVPSNKSGVAPGAPGGNADVEGELAIGSQVSNEATQPPSSPADTDKFEAVGTNPFVIVGHDPLSTFAADVDTASYDLFRSNVQNGLLPNKDSIRLEEFVNYFSYDYPAPAVDAEHPFAIHLDATPNLVDRGTQLLRVGIQGKVIPPDEEKKPANLVFLIDVSGSMQHEIPQVKATLSETVEILNPGDTFSIVTYASSPGTLLEATDVQEKTTVLNAIESLSSGGSTNGSGGINAAYAQAQDNFIEGGVNHVILMTDGDFNVGVTTHDSLEELIVEKRKTGVTLTALGFGSGNYNDAMMERISNAGNGIYGYIGSEADGRKYAQEKMLQSLVHIAQDMKIQVEFNPEHVYAYRLLGYENRAIADEDFRNDVVDAGEIGSGHRVTALYELVMPGEMVPNKDGAPQAEDGEQFSGETEVAPEDLVLVKVRYKQPGASEQDAAMEVSSSLAPASVAEGFQGASSDLQWAAAVAAYAEILKESPYASPEIVSNISLIIETQVDRDADRAEFFELFKRANQLRD